MKKSVFVFTNLPSHSIAFKIACNRDQSTTVNMYCPPQATDYHCTQLQNMTQHFRQTIIESLIMATVSQCTTKTAKHLI